ncbi:UNVERIFIED_ORG: hypothetical protein GGD43_000070 [Rhizobium esperanzae]
MSVIFSPTAMSKKGAAILARLIQRHRLIDITNRS